MMSRRVRELQGRSESLKSQIQALTDQLMRDTSEIQTLRGEIRKYEDMFAATTLRMEALTRAVNDVAKAQEILDFLRAEAPK